MKKSVKMKSTIDMKKSVKMKSKILLIGIFLITFVGITNAEEKQNDTIIEKGSYKFNQDLPKSAYNLEEDINKGNKIIVLYKAKDTVYFKYLTFKDLGLRDKYNGDKIFSMHKKEFKELTSRLYRRFKGVTTGAYIIPFKLRDVGSSNRNFDTEPTLSTMVSIVVGFGTRRSQKPWLDLSFGFGVSQVNLNSENSSVITEDDSMIPLIEDDSMIPLTEDNSRSPLTKDRTASAFTMSFGAVFKFTEYANLGIFCGWDFLGQKDKEIRWKYDKDTWIGLGINIVFKSIETTKSITESSQNN